jgi:hypothetical protein
VKRINQIGSIAFTATVVGLALILVLVAAEVVAGESEPSRLDRKVRVMERVIDEVLIQSPNVLVSGSGTARGLVLDEYGALFTLEASLLGLEDIALGAATDWTLASGLAKNYYRQALAGAKGDEEGGEDTGEAEEGGGFEEWQKKSEEARQQKLDAFKIEISDTLLDYGPTLNELDDGQWLTIVAFMGDRFHLLTGGADSQRLIWKAKMKDLRRYSSGQISRDEALGKIVFEQQ